MINCAFENYLRSDITIAIIAATQLSNKLYWKKRFIVGSVVHSG